MYRLRNIALRDYQESVTTGQTHGRTDRQTPDKVIPMCRYASQATQKLTHCRTQCYGHLRGHMVLSFLGLAYASFIKTNFPKFVVIFPTFVSNIL